ncbi:hypothetical protein [Cellulomonas composti]|nr:hypothetical protein [Cellulomonas composti]
MARTEDERLTVELTGLVLEREAPDELVLLDGTSTEYFDDPQAALAVRSRDEALGFGLELALLTPYVLAIASAVVQVLVEVAKGVLGDAAKKELTPHVVTWVRRVMRRDEPAAGTVPDGAGEGAGEAGPALTAQQARSVHDLAHRRALDLGLDENRAALLADAVVGGLVVAG